MAESNMEFLDLQKDKLKKLIQTPLKNGDTWYLIDSKWFKQWQAYVGFDSWDNNMVGDQSAFPGPIDNSNLFKADCVNVLRMQLMEEMDFTLVPEEAWNSLVQWYSLASGQEPIARKVIDQGVFNKNCKVEVYLVELKLCYNDDIENPITRQFSRADTLEQVEKEMRQIFNIEDERETRLWSKYMSNTYEPLKKLDNTVQDTSLYTGQVIVIEAKNPNGTWPRQAKFANSLGAVGDAAVPRSYGASSSSNDASGGTSSSTSSNINNYDSYSSSSIKSGTRPGLCGLSNLGNTCFMNSAIQCMSNVPPLTEYMRSERWKQELNRENPLGMNGEIATTYAELIRNMWSGKFGCAVPRQFKVAVGRFKPEFSGYQQQDSQELMAFLLDGLHEDLNRIRKKPYIEMREADNRPDGEVAKEAWEDYIKRNNSVIVDIFHGLLKSTLVCPECQKVSVKFDPFCYLSLPLPVKKERQLEVFFVQLNSRQRTKQYKLTVPKLGIISDLCQALSSLTKCPQEKMVVTDVYNHRFHKVFGLNESLSHITDRDDIFVYEVPLNTDDDQEVAVIPVYMREVREKTGMFSSGQSNLFGMPLLVGVPKNNCTYDDIYNRVMERISRYIRSENTSAASSENDSRSSQERKDEEEAAEDNSSSADEVENGSGEKDEMTSLCSDETETADGAKQQATPAAPNNGPQKRLFTFRYVNSYGSTDFEKLPDDGSVINLSSHAYIAADWHPKTRKNFFDEKEAEGMEVDESMENKPVTKKTIHLKDCLELFTTMEKLGEQDPWEPSEDEESWDIRSNTWYCPVCKKHQQATKKFDIWKLPNILVIHLKRFSYNRYWRDKLDTFIDYPTRGLDMSQFVIDPEHRPAVYDLIAVSNHFGGLGGGHYTAFAKNKDRDQWFNFDDSCVNSVGEDSVVTKSGYVLVYQMRESESSPPDLDSAEPPCNNKLDTSDSSMIIDLPPSSSENHMDVSTCLS